MEDRDAAARPGRWLAIVGIGEDGVEGLAPAARALVAGAELVVGGERHLGLAAPLIAGERLTWPQPFSAGLEAVISRRGARVVVLASGDPFDHGVGASLAGRVAPAEMLCLPTPSSVSLACARLGWARQETEVVSLCGRPLESLARALQPGRRLLALSADATTPSKVAAYLAGRGFARSRLHLLEALGGPHERVSSYTAGRLTAEPEPLNLLGLEIEADPDARVIPIAPGLPDAWFEHDGQITKREVRALTLSALQPRAGERLWDIGCGSGSVAIEWMLRHPANRAIGFERRPDRLARAARNALSLGAPGLELTAGEAPSALEGAPAPDAVFIGGGGRTPGLIAAAWTVLKPGGRLVVNAVAVETEAALLDGWRTYGGAVTRLSLERLSSVGGLHAFRPAMSVVQWAATKA